MNKFIHLFDFRGIPVGVSPWFFLLIFILSFNMKTYQQSLIFALVAVIALLTHEFGHALTAKHYKIRSSVILTGFGGVTPLETSPNRKQSFFITLAGPLSNIVLGCISLGTLLLLAVYAPGVSETYFDTFLRDMTWVNLFWGIFNILPIYPMDGGKLLSLILDKFCKPSIAPKIAISISLICCLGFIAYALINQMGYFTIFIAFYLMIINVLGAKQAFASAGDRSEEKRVLVAEEFYERGVAAARNHRWQELERYGILMKEASTSKDQSERAYEFLTIACTNTFRYEEALNYSKYARQSDAVRQAVERCHRMLDQ